MNTFLQDLRYGARRLVAAPAFTTVVVLTLALGIGANTAVFSVVNAVLLRPLPYREPERLVTINHFYPSLNSLEAPVSAPGFVDYRDRTRVFSGVAVQAGWAPNLTGRSDPERLNGTRVSALYFSTLGVPAAHGRTLLPEEDQPGRNRVVVLSDGLWRRLFAASPGAVGSTIQLNGETYEVVGVMPPGFRDFFGRATELWSPLALPPERYSSNERTSEWLNLTARLKLGTSEQQAAAEMATLASQLKRQYPDSYPPDWTLTVKRLDEVATGKIRPALLVLLGAVGFVLLIGCANVANLLLGRAATRLKEVAIRTALGASRWRVVRQLLVESLLLALAGGAAGLLLAYAGVRALVVMNPTNLPRAEEIGVDATVMLFTLGISLFTGVLFGLVPALQTSNASLRETLSESARGSTADRAGRNVRRALVVAEVALALTLLVGAGLLIQSVARLQRVEPGPWGDIRLVSPDFFQALRVPLRRGRVFTDQDGPATMPVAVVDDEMVRRYWPNEDPIGKRLAFGAPPGEPTRWITVVGVVGHTKHEGLDADARVQLYLPYRQAGANAMAIAVRTTGDPLAAASAVRAAVHAVDRDQPLSQVRSMAELLEASVGQRRLSMLLLGLFSAIALVLSAVGIYGVMSYSVAQRTREIGVRMALGAARTSVLGLVLRQGVVLTLAGVAAGVLASLALNRLLASQLYAVRATDPATFLIVAALLTGVATLACLLPALRATRVDPVVALRQE